MSNRYKGKVIKVVDQYTIVINKGSGDGILMGHKFAVVEIGEILRDPDTNEELEALEIVKGKVEVTHLQDKIATLKSFLTKPKEDNREITKTIEGGNAFAALYGNKSTIVESIKPGTPVLLPLRGVKEGDSVIRA